MVGGRAPDGTGRSRHRYENGERGRLEIFARAPTREVATVPRDRLVTGHHPVTSGARNAAATPPIRWRAEPWLRFLIIRILMKSDPPSPPGPRPPSPAEGPGADHDRGGYAPALDPGASGGGLARSPDLAAQRGLGAVRRQRPIYVDLLPPCNRACPAGESIQEWLAHAEAGRFEAAWRTIMRDNPFPALHGRICYHPCESDCNRERLDGTVSIHAVERFLGDRALRESWTVPIPNGPSGRRILIVGAGPAGLSAAFHLALAGHDVEIRDAGPLPGGMMHFGIPAYRLPRDVLAAEIARIEAMGVKITLNHKVADLAREREEGGFDAAFVAVGAHLSRRVEIPAMDAGRMLEALDYLRQVEGGGAPRLGRRVAIYGGGNTAMDAARTALRLGHEPMIIYRRDRDHAPAHREEVEEALAEGVQVHWLRTIKSIEGSRFQVEVMELDEEGRPRPTGALETVEADDLILALGQETDTAFLDSFPEIERKADGTVIVGADFMTGTAGIFAGGDMVPAERTVTTAVGHGKIAARHIDAWLRGERHEPAPLPEIASFEKLNLWFYTDAHRRPQPILDLRERTSSFGEVVGPLPESDAVREAKRCLSCGNCFECDGCYAACPEDAIIKLGPGNRYEYDYDRCTGCAICFEQCPCAAIEMIPEPSSMDEGAS
jgi:formate dehydrogenase (NADP+) beta subunit